MSVKRKLKPRGGAARAPATSKEPPSTSPPRELLLAPEVEERTRLSNTTLWRLEKANRFPKRRVIGFKRVAWSAVAIDAWIAGTWSPLQQTKAA